MIKSLKCGVLGCGSVGLRHAKNLADLDQSVSVFDVSQAKRENAENLGISVVKYREELLENSEALFICTPSEQHFSDINDGIKSKCHLFVEKPISTKTTGLESMLNLATTNGLVVCAGFNLRFNSAVLEAKSIIEEQKLGKILWGSFHSSHYLPSWRPHQDYREGYAANSMSGGVIFDIIHEFDLANLFLGSARAVACSAWNTGELDIQSEDCADIILLHQSGVRSTLHLDYITQPTIRLIKIAGTAGLLVIDLVGLTVSQSDTNAKVINNKSFKHVSPNSEYLKEVEHFINCIQFGTKPMCDGYDALNVLKQVIHARKLAGLPAS